MLKLHQTLYRAFPQEYQQTSKYTSKAQYDFIKVDEANITFTLQEGPVNETGLNGIQVPELLHFTKEYLKTLDKTSPNEYNKESIKHIDLAIKAQKARTSDRIKRGVEGTTAA